MWLLAAELCGERVAEARVDVPEEAEKGAAEAEEKVQKHHQLQVSEKLLLGSCLSISKNNFQMHQCVIY